MIMTYKTLADVNATQDLTELVIYVNDITGGYAMPLVLFGFFVVALLGSVFAQMRFKGTIRPDFSFASAAFVTFGLAVIMSLKNGLLNPVWLFLSIGLAVLGAVWLYLGREN